MPKDMYLLTRKRLRAITEWCDQVPVLGFNRGRYYLNLIKEKFCRVAGRHYKQGPGGKKSEHHDVYEDRPFSLFRHH